MQICIPFPLRRSPMVNISTKHWTIVMEQLLDLIGAWRLIGSSPMAIVEVPPPYTRLRVGAAAVVLPGDAGWNTTTMENLPTI